MQKVGRYTYSQNLKVVEHHGSSLTIGAFCSIGPKVTVMLGGNHRIEWVTTYPFGDVHEDVFGVKAIHGHPSTKGDVTIGNDVWIGCGATIMSGVKIGDGAVIAANSHVVNDVHPYEIVGGNPAKHIRYRFTQEIIECLLALKWWNRPDNEIRKLIPVLMAAPDLASLKELCK